MISENKAERVGGARRPRSLSSTVPRGSLALCLAVSGSLACSFQDAMKDQQNFAVYSQSPGQVVDALTSILVLRDELAADVAPQLGTNLLTAFQQRDEAQLTSQSISLGTTELQNLIPEEFRRFVSDAGGRYVLSITLVPAADGGLRVSVTPTIIATVGGGEGPLGGRPLPSNGTLESSVLQAMSERLGR